MSRNYLPGTQIEIINETKRGNIKHALFDFDGTISILREGWQEVMAPVMIDAIAGQTTPTPEIEKAVREYIDESTGINTILQMEHLVEMVREYGNVPEDEILDAYGYKEIYNNKLMEVVNKRIQQLSEGKLTIEQCTVKGSVEFVKALRERGLKMYVFSGTDQPDVRNEASLVGVAPYFDEILGALRTYAESNKEMILKNLIKRHNLHGSEVLVVGDGPVEIRHGRENGCICIGVASNEIEGHGWNEEKRERLIRAGADIMIPDFSEKETLISYLFP